MNEKKLNQDEGKESWSVKTEKQRGSFLTGFFSARGVSALVLTMFVGGLVGYSCNDQGWMKGVFADSPLKGKRVGTPVYELQKAFYDIHELYNDRVVFISTEKTVQVRDRRNPFFNSPFFEGPNEGRKKTRKQTGLGTGFIISNDGYICTNHHVVANVDKVIVKVGVKKYTAQVMGSDALTDIALLKIEGEEEFKPVYFGDSDKIRVGNWAIAIGNPFGLDRTFTVGVISATVRQDVDQIGNAHIQTDASINPGNSGGPLINLDGEVIGVNRMIYSRSGGSLGIGFAIPINTARNILEQLKKNKRVKRGFLGVQIAPLTEDFAKQLGLKSPRGALVGTVTPGSPADKAGIKERDVIISVGGKPVKTFRDLLNVVATTEIDKTVKVIVWRNKKKINLFVTIKERPTRL